MNLDKDDIRKLATLARIGVDDTIIEDVAGKISDILTMVDQMQAMDTEGVKPLAHPLDSAARLRPDVVSEEVDRDLYQQGAPETEDGLYLVPRVVE